MKKKNSQRHKISFLPLYFKTLCILLLVLSPSHTIRTQFVNNLQTIQSQISVRKSKGEQLRNDWKKGFKLRHQANIRYEEIEDGEKHNQQKKSNNGFPVSQNFPQQQHSCLAILIENYSFFDYLKCMGGALIGNMFQFDTQISTKKILALAVPLVNLIIMAEILYALIVKFELNTLYTKMYSKVFKD